MSTSISQHFSPWSLLKFTFPSIIMMMFMSLYTIVDGIFISRFIGSNALSSLNIVYPVDSIVHAGHGRQCSHQPVSGRGENTVSKRMSLPFYSDWLSVKSADVHPVPAFSGFHQPGARCQRSAVSRLPHLPQHPHGLCSGLHAPDSVPVLSGNCRSAAPRTLPHHDRRDHQRGTGLCTYRI